MNKLIPAVIALSMFALPSMAQSNRQIQYGMNNELANRTAPCVNYQYQQPTCTYTPQSPDINPPITQVQYPGALDPQNRLPAWVNNP